MAAASSDGGSSEAARELTRITELVRVVVDQGPRRAAERAKKHKEADTRRVHERGALLQQVAQSRSRIDHAVAQRQASLLRHQQ